MAKRTTAVFYDGDDLPFVCPELIHGGIKGDHTLEHKTRPHGDVEVRCRRCGLMLILAPKNANG